jgi:two-component system CheB/CheR fusion protein
VDLASVKFETAYGEIPIDLSLRRFQDPATEMHVVSIMLDPVPEIPDMAHTMPGDSQTVATLKHALQGSEDRLRSSLEHAQTSAEELRASNEELQAMNEELRSATEELEASKEELQSLNEELATVNSELQSKVEESAKVNDDLQNLISLTGVATIFVDREMRIKRYTAPAETLFNVIPSDKGRPLLDLTHRLVYDSLGDDLRAAFESLKTAEREVRSTDGRWLLARVLPYRTDDDRIDGAILALIDITARRHAEHQARASEERLKLAALATHDFAIVVMDENGTVVSWNAGAQRIFGFTVDEMIGKPLDAIFTDADRASGVPEQERRRALARGRADDERWYVARDGTRLLPRRVDTDGGPGLQWTGQDRPRRNEPKSGGEPPAASARGRTHGSHRSTATQPNERRVHCRTGARAQEPAQPDPWKGGDARASA